MSQPSRATRGGGLLEGYLARLRARQAERQLPESLRSGRLLDIGAGAFPTFLDNTRFAEKYALDQQSAQSEFEQISWTQQDLHSDPKLPFEDGFFDAVTLLAVAEHLDPHCLAVLMQEIHRTLRSGGRVVLTTPASWSDGLLKVMSRLRLVSPEEIDEHCFAFDHGHIGWHLGQAGFELEKIEFGFFELGLNLWATAER